MNIQCMCSYGSVMRLLIHTHRLNGVSTAKNFLCTRKVFQNFFKTKSRIICTNSNRQSFNCEIQEPIKEQQSFYLQENFLKENFNIVDSRYLKLVTLPSECNNLEELLWTNEFKTILSRSPFLYDVNVIENSKSFLSESTSLHEHAYEDVLYVDKNSTGNNQSLNECHTVLFSSSHGNETSQGKATEEQLLHIINRLTYSLVNFFEHPHDYSIYHKNIIFLNNIKGVKIKGINAYAQNMYLMKIYGFLHFAKVKVEILKVTHHVEDGSVRVRWRVNGLPRHKLVIMLWKHKDHNWKNLSREETEWLDGFSIFSVGDDGLIYKHICDKMMPDDDQLLAKKGDLRSRVLRLLGLTPRGPAGTLNNLIPCCRSPDLLTFKKIT